MKTNNKTTVVTNVTLLLILAALCLCASAAAQSSKEKEFVPTTPQKAEASRLRGALAAAVGENFEVTRDHLTRRSNWHGGGIFWLAHLRAQRPGWYSVKYKYRYKDHARPKDPLYTFVEHKMTIGVGERGCARRPRYNSVCVGDTVILPVVFDDYTEHAFTVEAQPHTPRDPAQEKSWRDIEENGLHRDPVPNPAAEFMKYVGRRAHYSPHRSPGFTLDFYATFEAVKPGSFNLAVGTSTPTAGPQTISEADLAGSVPVVVVAPGQPVTILSAQNDVHAYSDTFASTGGGNGYLSTPVILQVGERLTLRYSGYSHRGRSRGGENEEALEASVKQHAPSITLLPFYVDPARDFNEWLVDFLPPARRE
jgi:hypothetical protein